MEKLKKREILPLWHMDGTWGHNVKWSKWDREKQRQYDLTYMWNLK